MYSKVLIYCKNAGISIREFERRCGLSNGLVKKWEDGFPSFPTLEKIVDATGLSIEYWLEDEKHEVR